MIPRTPDSRVLFAIPWHGQLMVGTTDVAADRASWHPEASAAEVEFILDTARGYLQTPPSASDVLATFAGLRPLFSPRDAQKRPRTISREHAIVIEHEKLLTVIGGKWTTYRKMALDAIDHAVTGRIAGPAAVHELRDEARRGRIDRGRVSTPLKRRALVSGDDQDSDGAMTKFVTAARRYEQALYADDIISRRLRIGALDQAAAVRIQPQVERAAVAIDRRRKKGHSMSGLNRTNCFKSRTGDGCRPCTASRSIVALLPDRSALPSRSEALMYRLVRRDSGYV